MLTVIEFRYVGGNAVTLEFYPEQLLVSHDTHVRGYPWSWLYRDIVQGVIQDFKLNFVADHRVKFHEVIESTHYLSQLFMQRPKKKDSGCICGKEANELCPIHGDGTAGGPDESFGK